MIYRIRQAWRALRGKPLDTAVEIAIMDLLMQARRSAHIIHTLTKKFVMPNANDPVIQTAEFNTAVQRIQAVNAYLKSLPALFIVMLAALEKARQEAQIGSPERAELQATIDTLQERNDTLESLIGEAAGAAAEADAADDTLTAAVASPFPVDPAGPAVPETDPETDTPPNPDPVDPVTDPDPVLDPITDPAPAPEDPAPAPAE